MDPRSSNEYRDRWTLVTGGSVGIGYELARLFARAGARVILVAREADKLEQAASSLEKESGSRPLILSMDLSRPEAPAQVLDWLSLKNIRVEVLVNNAGFGLSGPFRSHDAKKTLGMIDVNVRSLVELTQRCVGDMVERGWGRILNVASTAAFQAVPTESVYAATKAFVVSFSEGIAEELAGTGVRVTCLCPGPTDTPFFKRGDFRPSKFMKTTMMDAATVARIGFEALGRGKSLVVAGLQNHAAIFAGRLVPRTVATKVAKRMVQ